MEGERTLRSCPIEEVGRVGVREPELIEKLECSEIASLSAIINEGAVKSERLNSDTSSEEAMDSSKSRSCRELTGSVGEDGDVIERFPISNDAMLSSFLLNTKESQLLSPTGIIEAYRNDVRALAFHHLS